MSNLLPIGIEPFKHILPVHRLKLRWLMHRKLFISKNYFEWIEEIHNEWMGNHHATAETLKFVDEAYDLQRKFKKDFKV